MADPVVFPDQPIRVPKPGGWDFPTSDEQAELDDPEEGRCWTCGGDGMVECDGDCPASDDCGCPYANAHLTTCPNCRGSGAAKDVWYW